MATATLGSFLDTLSKSGLVEAERLDGLIDKLRSQGELPEEPADLADAMIREGFLTPFQANQLLQGRYRGFYISKYRILERLGTGGMGTVYLAEHKFMKRRVALKVLPRSRAADNAALERFYREAKAVAALDHPNIVRAYDIDQDKDLHFLVMEYVEGVSLLDIVRVHGALEPAQAAHYIYQAAKGLHHAHEIGLVHRDIKPANLLVDRNGVVKLLDLGLARFFHDQDDMLTRKYDEKVLGTADYLAPEQALDSHAVDIRADIYSLGCTFYFLLAGRPPFADGTVAQKLVWHQTRRPTPLAELRQDVSASLVAVLEKMLAKKPAERQQTPLEVAKELEPHIDVLTPPPPPGAVLSNLESLAAATTDTATPAGATAPGSSSSGSLVNSGSVVASSPSAVGSAARRDSARSDSGSSRTRKQVAPSAEQAAESLFEGAAGTTPPTGHSQPPSARPARPLRSPTIPVDAEESAAGHQFLLVMLVVLLLIVLALGGIALTQLFQERRDAAAPAHPSSAARLDG